MRQQVRKLRHWKQRFDRNAAFVWRRRIKYAGKPTEIGEDIPEALATSPTKLRRFWESGTIELAEFEAPNVSTGQVEDTSTFDASGLDLPEGVTVERGNGSWFLVRTGDTDGSVKVNGRMALGALLDTLRKGTSDDAETLHGSNTLESTYEIGDETIVLGEVVAMAHEDSGLTVQEWNSLANEEREALLVQALGWMTDEGPDDEPEVRGLPESDDATSPGPEAADDGASETPAAETPDAWEK